LWWLLLLAVLGLHAGLFEWLDANYLSLADASGRPGMRRMQASYTRLLTPQAPVAAPAAPPPSVQRPPVRPAAAPALAAAAAPAASDAAVDPASAAQGAELMDTASDAALAAAAPASAASDAADTPVTDDAATAALAGAAFALAPGTPAAAAATAASAGASAAPSSAAPAASTPPVLPQLSVQAGTPAPASSTAVTPLAAPASAQAGAPSAAVPTPRPAPAPGPAVAQATELLDGIAWPLSTRLRYELKGWYRGAVHGSAQVEWLREGRRYQVHLEVLIGPSFAPLVRRRMSSEGRISPDGLAPQRYEQETWQIIGRTRRADMVFGPEQVLLATGQHLPRPADVQDTASQFVQMVFLLTRRPELAQAGRSVEFALALPHRIDRWTYDMAGRATLDTPVGPVETVHVRPRRRAGGGDLTAQMWLAPSLQMLPARIRIEQDEDTWADLLLQQAPEQAAPPAASAAAR
jgi:hypothetical protein